MAKALRERLTRPLSIFILLLGMLLPLGWKALGGPGASTSLARLAHRALPGAVLAAPRADLWGRPVKDPSSLPIVPGATWRYEKGIASAPPAGWTTAGFDDSAWLEGNSGFGYGDGDDATALADMQNGYTSIYIRKEFALADLSGIGGLTLTIDYDDACVVYVNGAEVARSASMGGTVGVPPAYNATAASGHEASGGDASPQPPDLVTIPVSALVAGTNAIAIAGFNQSIGSGDFSLLPTVEILNAPPAPPAGATPPDGQTGVSTSPPLCVTVSDPEGAPLDVTFHGREAGGNAGDDFTVIALPDTQYYAAFNPATFQTQTAWIRDQRAARNIVMVTGLGDCVDDAALQSQWDAANAAYGLLENPLTTGLPDGIPYGVAVGNHDQDPNGFSRIIADENAPTVLYNQTFPKSRFSGRGYFGGNYPLPGFADSMDNHFELWSAGGMDFITFHLEWDDGSCSWPASGAEPAGNLTTCQEVLRWVRTQLTGPHASRRAIITTHFMGTPSSDGTGTLAFSPQGQAILNAVRPLSNVFLLLGGHLDQADHRVDLAVDGHAITTLVSDYQTRPNGGDGWLRILTFKPEAGAIHVETYSPLLGRFINKLADGTPNSHADNLAPSENEITVPYAMDAGNPFSVIGTDTAVPSGLQACVTWPNLHAATAYEWYATVTDGVSSTTGGRQNFTTTSTCTQTSECDDGNPCTADACNTETSLCEHAPIAGCCVTAADCNDANVCTDDLCTAGECGHADNTAPCSDGSACTTGDACGGGACVPGAPLGCDDGNGCTVDGCAPATGCTHVRDEVPGCCTANSHCDDGDAGTLDQCDSGTCTHDPNPTCDTPADCDDSNVCTADTCSGAGFSLGLDGSTQYVTMGTAPGLGTASFTLEAWVKWDGPQTGSTASSGNNGVEAIPILTKGRGEDDGSNVDCNYFFGIDGGAHLTADFESLDPPVGGNNNYPVVSTATVSPSVWHHVAVTYDAPPGTGCWDLYLDGAVVTGAAGRCPGTTPRYDSIQHFGLGAALDSAGDAAGRFAGRLDEARVWGVARTAAEIQAGMFQPNPAGTGLLGHWGFDDGTTATDSAAPPAENGVLAGAPSFSASDKPPLGSGLCEYTTLSCDDGSACTADSCDAVLGCGHAPANEGGTCNDGDPCTGFDACHAGTCTGSPNGQCCSQDSQCDDGNPCTANSCDEANAAALAFDGVDDTVDLGTAAAVANLGTGSFTVEGWMETDGGNNDLTGVFRWGRQQAFPQVVVQLSGAGAPYRNLRASVETSQVSPTSQVDTPITAATLIPVNAWTHFALVADRTPGAQELRLYVNGDLAASADASAWGTNPISTTDSATLGAARLADGTLSLYFDGRLDEVRMWSTARTEAEIESAMHEQVDAAPGLLARWGMNEGTGTTTEESVSHAPAQVIGAAWSASALANLGSGACTYAPLTGTPCNDGDACTVNDTCSAGACTSGSPRNCDDGNSCTDDACDDESGCVHTHNASACDDGNACTTGDVCSDGACAGGSLVSCDDGDACTVDACNPATGCTHAAGACDDGNPCTTDTCDPVLGCGHETLADGTACSDGNACTTVDACSLGVCDPGPLIVCNDGNVCTDDACNPASGCIFVNNTASCSDGNPCTSGDACAGGACAGTPILCDDQDPCTADACSEGICVFAPAADICSDGVACTTDVCSAGPPQSSLQFSGTAAAPQYVGMGPGTPRLGLARFTVEAWIQWGGGGAAVNTGNGGFNPADNGGAIPIAARGRGESDGGLQDANYFLGLKDGRLVADFEEGTGGTGPLGLNHPVCGSTLLDTSWHHVAATYDGACWQLYVDGVAETLSTACSSCAATGACNVCPGQPPRSDSIQHFGIGSALDSTGAPDGAFQGRIDEVRVWSYARTAAEIATTRDKRVAQSFGLAGRWGLDDGTGATAADSAGGDVNGTLFNDPAWSAGAPPLGAALCASGSTAACCTQDSDCNDSNACTADVCDQGTRACTHAPVTSACDDGNGCTTGDACIAGVCTGSAIPNCCDTSAQCDDGNACTEDICRPPNVSALQFDGINDSVTMGPALGPDGLGLSQFTLEGWIKWTGGGVPAGTGQGGLNAIPIVTKGRGEADDGNIDANYFLGIVNGKLAADFEQMGATLSPAAPSGQNRPICGSIALPVNAWVHVAATYDGTWRLYVNGVEGTDADGTACTSPACDPAICTQSPGALPRSDSIQHFALGTAVNSTGQAAGDYQGQMDEVRVWSRALTQAEIAAHMNEQFASGTGLVARWGFDENGGGVLGDSVGPTFHNGTLAPNPSIGPTWVTAGIVDFGHQTCAHRTIPVAEIGPSLRLSQSGTTANLSWNDPPGDYNVYRGTRSGFAWNYNGACLESHLSSPAASDTQTPAPGQLFYYNVTRLGTCGESVPGRDSRGDPYPNTTPCP